MRLLIALIVFLAAPTMRGSEGVDITVTVTNIPGAKGNLLVGLYDSAKSFTDRPLPQSLKIPVTSAGSITATIRNVKPGVYAISVIQDLNENGKLDRAFGVMPKEPLGFSRIREIPRGKPSFEACSFEVGDKNLSLTIPLTVK
jgi:uncharacterized protein (DUF2141 family)